MTHAPVHKCIAAARCDTFFNEPRPHWVDMHWRGARRPHADVRLCRHACDESRPAEAGLRSGRQLRTPQLVHGISIHPDGSAARPGCGRPEAPGCSSWRADTCRARHRGSGCRPMVWAVCAGRHASCSHRAPQSSPQQGADRSGSCPTLWKPWGAGRTGQIRRARTKDAIGSGRSTAADRPPGAPAISSTTCPVRRSSSPRR